jgi:hypothetical protein
LRQLNESSGVHPRAAFALDPGRSEGVTGVETGVERADHVALRVHRRIHGQFVEACIGD